MKGTIKKIVPGKDFGFIAREEGGAKDLFFHSNEVKGVTFAELKEGDAVTFEVAQGEKGPNAANVTRA
jgi:CspA family cold shock protein